MEYFIRAVNQEWKIRLYFLFSSYRQNFLKSSSTWSMQLIFYSGSLFRLKIAPAIIIQYEILQG